MKHEVRFERGHDCIRFECAFGKKDCVPGGGGSHGVHGLTVRFLSIGEEGAVQFTIYTGWLPQRAKPSNIGYREVRGWTTRGNDVTPADLGYHAKKPRYDGQTQISESCEYCDGGPCYYDGSGLNANDAMYALVNGGDKTLWEFLDAYYGTVFDGKPYPAPAEYEKAVRASNPSCLGTPHGEGEKV